MTETTEDTTADVVATPTIPVPRAGGLWPTRVAVPYVATIRGITHESARKWLSRHVTPVSREPGREGENLYNAALVIFRAPCYDI